MSELVDNMQAVKSGVTIEYPEFCTGRALGKNGVAHNAGVRVTISEAGIRLQPIAKRALAMQQAWIELPNHPSVLRQLQAVIAQALHDAGAEPVVGLIDVSTGEIDAA